MTAKRFAIIGCGYIGSALGAELSAQGHDVVGTTTSPPRTPELSALGIRPVVLQMSDEPKLHALLADREVVILTIAPSRTGSCYQEVYLQGVRHLLAAVTDTPVRHVVYTSSSAVYGQRDGSWVDENDPTEPAHENGQILLATEQELLQGGNRLDITVTILRLSGIYGLDRGPINVVSRYAGQSRDDGDKYVNLIHRDDIVAGITSALERPYDGVLNLTCDQPVLRRELYDALLAARGLEPITWIRQEPLSYGGKRIRNDRIKNVLALRLKHPTVEFPPSE